MTGTRGPPNGVGEPVSGSFDRTIPREDAFEQDQPPREGDLAPGRQRGDGVGRGPQEISLDNGVERALGRLGRGPDDRSDSKPPRLSLPRRPRPPPGSE